MPCEACNVQFTVFRRKRCCFDCKRFYCSNCLSAAPPNRWPVSSLCERCSVFAKRPLRKVDLLQLKPKDLIFYLQSQHISTAGCVEKDELVGLVLNHIQQLDMDQAHPSGDASFSGASAARGFDPAHSFDSIKQSCQHFFSNISDKVDSFSFEAKSDKHASHNNRRSSSSASSPTIQTAHISEQPRVSTREIPTYSSSQTRDVGDGTANNNYTPCFSSNNINLTLSNHSGPSQDSDAWHEGCQVSAEALSLESQTLQFPTKPSQPGSVPLLISPGIAKRTRSNNKTLNDSVSGCDCSDDELITTFRTRARERLQSSQSTFSPENPVAAPSGSFVGLASTSIEAKKSPSLKVDSYEESSESSFEELGAIGGISDDSKTGADTSAYSNETWQFVDKEVLTVDVGDGQHHELASSGSEPLTVAVLQPELSIQVQQRPVFKTTRSKKVTRRRSDGYLNRRRFEDESPTSLEGNAPSCSNIHDTRTLREVIEAYNERDEGGSGNNVGVNRFHCKRCGKNRINIKKHVEKMRHYLENSQMPECDIKRELEMFLEYLEKRTKSFDCSDSETTAASSVSGARDTNCRILPPPDASSQLFDDNEGIHVYAGPENYNATVTDSRFINLEDFESLEELENLCVKQLKEVLMLNRIDYKGCCEKQELLERVVRLWKNLKSTPAIDKLQTDELCKICMDAPIECVILECGHMSTCLHCGKVLSECPICRQYIVRVVRIFKA